MAIPLGITRRQFLLGSSATAILLTAGTSLRHIGDYPKSNLNLRNLSNKEAHIYRTIGSWLLPPGGPLPGQGGDDETILGIDAMLSHVPAGKRSLLAALPLVFEHGTALKLSQRLTEMSSSDAAEYLQDWATSAQLIPAQLFAALRTMYGFSYFERVDVLKAMGLPPICVHPGQSV